MSQKERPGPSFPPLSTCLSAWELICGSAWDRDWERASAYYPNQNLYRPFLSWSDLFLTWLEGIISLFLLLLPWQNGHCGSCTSKDWYLSSLGSIRSAQLAPGGTGFSGRTTGRFTVWWALAPSTRRRIDREARPGFLWAAAGAKCLQDPDRLSPDSYGVIRLQNKDPMRPDTLLDSTRLFMAARQGPDRILCALMQQLRALRAPGAWTMNAWAQSTHLHRKAWQILQAGQEVPPRLIPHSAAEKEDQSPVRNTKDYARCQGRCPSLDSPCNRITPSQPSSRPWRGTPRLLLRSLAPRWMV